MSRRGLIFDGLSARGRPVTVEVDLDGLTVTFDDGATERVALDALTRGASTAERMTVHRDDTPDWRLIVTDPELSNWAGLLPPVGRFRRKKVVAYSVVSAALLVGAIALWLAGDGILDVAASLVPHRLLEPMGDAVVKGIGFDQQCNAPGGQIALDRLLDRLRPPTGFVEPVRISVVDVDTINAFAVPGGRIVVLRGLIDQAKGPDELAGVVAHEITHVQLRHPTKALIRSLGLSTLVQSMAGQTGELVDHAILLSSSRDAERAADAGALKLLRQANISPNGMADFFKRMEAKSTPHKKTDRAEALLDRLSSFAATHPGDAERISAIEAAGQGKTEASAAMSDEDWKKLRTICDDDDGDRDHAKK